MSPRAGLVLLPSWGITDIPLTLSSLASHLRRASVETAVFDLNVTLYHLLSEFRSWWEIGYGLDVWETEDFVDRFWTYSRPVMESLIDDVLRNGPTHVGFSLFSSNRLVTERFARALKDRAPNVEIVFGGPEVGYLPDLERYAAENPHIGRFVVGEGEDALLRIVRGEETRRIVKTMTESPSLDSLPSQDFAGFDFDLYKDIHAFPTYSSRGCPNACIYCTERNFIGRFRTRSAQRVFEDVKIQKTRHPFLRTFRLHESVSNGNIRSLESFCDLMTAEDLGLRWAIPGAVMRKEMDARLCTKLRKAGCFFINYGLETPSAKVLAGIGKKLSKGTDFERVVRETHDAGITVALNIMFGLPGETEEDFQLQLEFLRRNHRCISVIAPSLWFTYFPPGSEGWSHAGRYDIDIGMGPLWWSSKDGSNTYPVRMRRFVEYTDLMQELDVDCLFGFPVLPNRLALLRSYTDELAHRGRATRAEAEEILRRNADLETAPPRRKGMLRDILKKIIYRIAPAAIHGAVTAKARNRLLEERLAKMLREDGKDAGGKAPDTTRPRDL